MTAVKSSTHAAKKRSSTLTHAVKHEGTPHVISRRYLSPLGKGEISSRRITAAIKAVKKARALFDIDL